MSCYPHIQTDGKGLQYRCTSVSPDGLFCYCGNGKWNGNEFLCGDPKGQYAPDYCKGRCGFAEKI